MSRARGYCFTINNYEEATDVAMGDCCILACIAVDDPSIDYMVFGREVAPTTGTKHLQGYIHFKNAKSLSAVLDLFPVSGMHLTVARGTAEQNREYCTKEDENFVEIGELPQQGRRTDIHDVRDALTNGASLRSIAETCSSYQALRGAQLLFPYMEVPRTWKTHVIWFYGPSGSGKTRKVYFEVPSFQDIYAKSADTGKWWDGYDSHPIVLLDDLRVNDFTFTFLLRLFDRYPLRIETKGGTRQFMAKKIYVTSPFAPSSFVPPLEEALQLTRRIEEVVEFVEEWLPPVEEEVLVVNDE